MILLKKDNIIVATLLAIVAFTMPFGLVNNINSISIILLAVYATVLTIKNQNILLKNNKLLALPLIYFFFLILTLTYSDRLLESVKQVEKNLPFLLFPLLFFILKKYMDKKTTLIVVFSFVLGSIMALLVCLFFAVYSFYLGINSDPLLKGSFYFTELLDLHPTYFSMYLIMCIVFIRNYTQENHRSLTLIVKVLLFVLTLLLWISIIYLKSRSGIFALILVEISLWTIFFLNKFRKINRKVFWLFFVTIGMLLIFLTINSKEHNYGQEYFKRDTNAAINDRLKNWNASFDAISEAPFLGNGLYDSNIVRDIYFYINGYDIGIDKNYNSHNQFIETTIIGGVFGLTILLLMLFSLLVLFKKNKNTPVLSFFIILLVVMMTESILVRQHGIIFFSFFYVFFNTRINEN